MDSKTFFGKMVSRYLLYNLAAMVFVVVALCVALNIGLSSYTHHGEGIEVPDLYGQELDDAKTRLAEQGLLVVVNDTGYNKRLEADCILSQMPGAGTKVKEGRTIYVTINSTSSPLVAIPDIIDNSSYREAQARLSAIGFRLSEPQVIDGERDWVYGVKAGSRNLQSGDMVSVEALLTLVIGNGNSENEDRAEMMLDVPTANDGETDDFEEVRE